VTIETDDNYSIRFKMKKTLFAQHYLLIYNHKIRNGKSVIVDRESDIWSETAVTVG